MTSLSPLTAVAFVVVLLLAGTDNAQVRFAGRSSRIALPSVPFTDDYLQKSEMIFQAIEILYVPLWELRWKFLEAPKTKARKLSNAFVDLCSVLNHFKVENSYKNRNLPENFKKMQVLYKAFIQMYAMRTEVSHQSYSVGCFESDAKTLVDVAKYLDDLSGRTTTGRGGLAETRTETSGESSTTRRGLIGERTGADGGSLGRSQSLIDRSRSGTTSGSLRRSQSSPPGRPTLEKEILMALGNRDRSSGRIDDKCSGRSSKIVDCTIDSSRSNSGSLLG